MGSLFMMRKSMPERMEAQGLRIKAVSLWQWAGCPAWANGKKAVSCWA